MRKVNLTIVIDISEKKTEKKYFPYVKILLILSYSYPPPPPYKNGLEIPFFTASQTTFGQKREKKVQLRAHQWFGWSPELRIRVLLDARIRIRSF